jgi:hypothetical protein
MRRTTLLITVCIALIIIAVALALAVTAPGTSQVTVTRCLTAADTGDCLRFPTVSGTNLLDEAFTLPADFAGDLVLVVVPFTDAQQILAESWLQPARDLAAQHPGLAYYNTAIFTAINPALRVVIRAGMSLAIGDEALRAVTLTLFLDDRDAFLQALAIPDPDELEVFLLNTDGEVLWRGRGIHDPDQGAQLEQAVTDA